MTDGEAHQIATLFATVDKAMLKAHRETLEKITDILAEKNVTLMEGVMLGLRIASYAWVESMKTRFVGDSKQMINDFQLLAGMSCVAMQSSSANQSACDN